ncbi:MAG: ribosomal protein S18-alanine N-acetyltransferase [bacterium]
MSASQTRENEASVSMQPFDPSDMDELMEIENSSFTLPWSRESYEELWPLESIKIWVARAGDELVGYYLTQIVGEEMELHTFAVKPEFRRRGIGRMLLNHMLDEARVRGTRRIYLQVRPSNDAARSLYNRLGFVAVGVRRGYYRDNSEDAIVMRLELK